MLTRLAYVLAALLVAMLVAPAAALAKCRMKNPDLAIAGVRLLDAESAVRVVGSGVELRGGEEDLPHASFVNKHGSEQLDLFAHYGAISDEYAEAEVHEASSQALVLTDLPIETFRSERGVALGMSVDEVLAIFGTCLKAREADGDAEILQYELKKSQMDADLKRLGYELYFAEYEFLGGRLARFRFGFEHP